MDDFYDMIERLFLDGDIDGIKMSLACAWLEMNSDSPEAVIRAARNYLDYVKWPANRPISYYA